MKFKEITDEEWNLIKPNLPPPARTGRPRADDRSIINGILFVILTGCRWMDLPEKYGSHKTAWRRHGEYSAAGVWKSIMDLLLSDGYSSGKLQVQSLSIDSSTVPAKRGKAGRLRWP